MSRQGLKERSRALRQQGCSIDSIANQLTCSKSTVHWHVKDIRLTRKQRMALRHSKRNLMREVNARRRGKSLKREVFNRPGWSDDLVHLIAHLSFDGRVDRFGCHYYSRSSIQVRDVRVLLERLLGIRPSIAQRSDGIWRVSYYHVECANWLADRERELLAVIEEAPAWRLIWLKALFDDEGHVHMAGHVRRVRASQKQLSVLESAQRFLAELGIPSRIDRCAMAVEVTRRRHLQTFQEAIGFSHGLAVNGRRANSLWKQDIEKNVLLERLLSSYVSPALS